MNTKMLEQFDVMNEVELSAVEGGGWVKCGLGTVGSAGLGFLSGASVGGWSGAAVGAATFC